MILHPRLRAHCSAQRNRRAPVPRLRSSSSTTKPFTSARSSTSISGETLTCSQAITLRSDDSATSTACWLAGLILRNRCAISAGFAGYPNWPQSSAIRTASLLFARLILTPACLVVGLVCFCFGATAVPGFSIYSRK